MCENIFIRADGLRSAARNSGDRNAGRNRVILSGASASHSEAGAESKDPYFLNSLDCIREFSPCSR